MPEGGSRSWPPILTGAACTLGAVAVVVWWRRRVSGLRISRLCVYPIKSCRGHSVPSARLTAEGLCHDREFAIIRVVEDGTTAVALTQREVPLLALISPELPTDESLTMHREGMRSITLPLCKHGVVSASDAAGGAGVLHQIEYHEWWDVVAGVDQGDAAADWLREALRNKEDKNDAEASSSASLRLVRFSGCRATPQPETFGEGLTRFSDGFGLLLTSEASLKELGAKTGLGQVCERMRPNIVVAGCRSHEEDDWSTLRLRWLREEGLDKQAEVTLRLPKPCARCTIPRVDPSTGAPGIVDPNRALKGYRSGRALATKQASARHASHYEANKGEIFFGQNVNASVGCDVILRVGDPLLAA